MPNFSFTTLTIGARPLVVHDAHDTTAIEDSYTSSSLRPPRTPRPRPWWSASM